MRIAAARGREVRLQRERAIAARADLEKGRRGRLPKNIMVKVIMPDENTRYLGGPEGTTWVRTAEGTAYIIAARSDTEIKIAERLISQLIERRIVPYGFPLNQVGVCAMFNERATEHCIWLNHTLMPAPEGAKADALPTQAGLLVS